MKFAENFKLRLSLLLFSPLWLFCQLLPYRTQLLLGKPLGRLLLHCKGRSYRTTIKNLQLCYPELSRKKRAALLCKSYQSLGMAFMEMLMSWWLPTYKTNTLLAVYGREHVDNALKTHGVILLSPHFNTLELCGRLLSQYFDFAVMYRPQKIKLLDRLMYHYRKKYYTHIIARQEVRKTVKALKEKKIVWYAADGDHGKQHSVFAPFFGIPAATLTGTSRIAKMSGAKVIPCFFYRRKNARGYDLYLHPPLTDFPSHSLTQDATRINQILEEAIRKAPEQYIWQYKRFKTRPAGEKRFYD